MDFSFLQEVTYVFAIAIAVVFLCSRIKLPAIIGFLLTGIFVGPYGFSLISSVHEIELLAEIGVVFLLFTIGLELSITELVRLRYAIFIGGSLQVLLTSAIVLVLLYCVGFSFATSLVLGFITSLSSTAIVLKILQARGSVESPHGKIILAMLILQDLIIVPMVLMIPFLSGSLDNIGLEIAFLLGKLLLLVAFFIVARKYVPWILRQLMLNTNNKEVLLLAILVLCLSVSFITSSIGLSLSLGAFLAGLLISESEYSLSSLEGVLPFKEVFTSLFFISVGMLFNIHFAFDNIFMLLCVTLLILVIKILIAFLCTLVLRYPVRVALLVGFSLAQIGEFSFILAKDALRSSLLSNTEYQYVLGASILTMMLTPFLISYAPKLVEYLMERGFIKQNNTADPAIHAEEELQDHIIIVGFGVAGRRIAKAAKKTQIPYAILELNPKVVQEQKLLGENIYYGDAMQMAMLEALNIARARILVLVIPDMRAIESIVKAVSKQYPSVCIIVRSRFSSMVREMYALGASFVIAEECEGSIALFANVLMQYHLPINDIQRLVEETRKEQYESLYYDAENTPFKRRDMGLALTGHKVITVRVGEDASIIGETLSKLRFRQRFNINIIAIVRDGVPLEMIDGDTIIQADDILYCFGDAEVLQGILAITGQQRERIV